MWSLYVRYLEFIFSRFALPFSWFSGLPSCVVCHLFPFLNVYIFFFSKKNGFWLQHDRIIFAKPYTQFTCVFSWHAWTSIPFVFDGQSVSFDEKLASISYSLWWNKSSRRFLHMQGSNQHRYFLDIDSLAISGVPPYEISFFHVKNIIPFQWCFHFHFHFFRFSLFSYQLFLCHLLFLVSQPVLTI